eukprot:c23981_g1_i1 orf=799-1689(-)
MEGVWSRLLQPVQLTSSGRPQLLPEEIECQLVDNVDLDVDRHSFGVSTLKVGLLTLTTHRILLVDERTRKGGAIPLAAIHQVVPPKKSIKNMFATPRIKLQVWTTPEGIPSFSGERTATASLHFSLVLRGQMSLDSFLARLSELLQVRAWEASVQEKARHLSGWTGISETSAFVGASGSAGPSRLRPGMAGVSGILRKEQEQREETDRSLYEAFQDLNALMSKAKEMVVLAEKMRAKLLGAPSGMSGAVDEEEMGSKQEMQDWLLSVGIVSPVTKETAGALYHQQLSRQVHLLVLS